MLKGIKVELFTPFDSIDSPLKVLAKKIIYSGEIDRLFKYSLGYLKYRGLFFENHTIKGDYQGCATINYPDKKIPYTRILEHKHYGWRHSKTSVYTFEYPKDCLNGNPANKIPYYPFRDAENIERYNQYLYLLEGYPNIIIGGRIGSYQYLNMDQTIAQAISKAWLELKNDG
jgi:UDP-galactopyranose mutase